jgi:hypothetical protein
MITDTRVTCRACGAVQLRVEVVPLADDDGCTEGRRCTGGRRRRPRSIPPLRREDCRTTPRCAWKVYSFTLTDVHLTQKAPRPRSRYKNPSHPTLGHHPRPRRTMVPRWSPQKPLGPVDHDTEAAANPATC